MSTASTQFEDERRLYFVIEQRHREAERREQIRLARGDRTDTLTSIASRAQDSIGTMFIEIGVRIRHNPGAFPEQAVPASSVPKPG